MIEEILGQSYTIREDLTLGELSDIQDASLTVDPKTGIPVMQSKTLRAKLIASCVEGMAEEKAVKLPAAVGMRLYLAVQRANKIPLFD